MTHDKMKTLSEAAEKYRNQREYPHFRNESTLVDFIAGANYVAEIKDAEISELRTSGVKLSRDVDNLIQERGQLNQEITRLRLALENAGDVIHSEFCSEQHHRNCIDVAKALTTTLIHTCEGDATIELPSNVTVNHEALTPTRKVDE